MTVEDLQKHKCKYWPTILASADNMILLLKRYTNLLYALFSGCCALYLVVKKLIIALTDFTPQARATWTLRNKAVIMWILLLQSRHFAMLKMDTIGQMQFLCQQLEFKTSTVCGMTKSPKTYSSRTRKNQPPPKKSRSPNKMNMTRKGRNAITTLRGVALCKRLWDQPCKQQRNQP